MKNILFCLLAFGLLSLTSCDSTKKQSETADNSLSETLKLEDTEWQLIALFVEPIDSNPENYYLIFDPKEQRIRAKANCNVLNMSYTLSDEKRLSIKDGISTKMACPDDTEVRFLKALRETDYFEINANELYLFQDKQIAPLAKFKQIKSN